MIATDRTVTAKLAPDAGLDEITEDYAGSAFSRATECPICASRSKVAHGAFNIHPARPWRFDLRVCLACNHGWIDPMPSQGLLNYLYGRGSYSVVGTGWAEATDEDLSLPARFVAARELDSCEAPGVYLELGVGKGGLYSLFLQRGWRCLGVEPGNWGRRFPGVCQELESLPSCSADVIVALDVLEHVADPIATLGSLSKLAAPAARLYCAMPNRESVRAWIGRARWRMLRPLGHLHYWSRASLTRALRESGFVIDQLRKTDLWQPRPIRTLRDLAAATVEHIGLGDQWLVLARARSRNAAFVSRVP